MMLLKVSEQYACDTEDEAREMIDKFKDGQDEGNYTLGKAGYTYKTKKAKGEIIAEKWVLDVTKIFGGIWDDII